MQKLLFIIIFLLILPSFSFAKEYAHIDLIIADQETLTSVCNKTVADGCYIYPPENKIYILNTLDTARFKFILFHELGHYYLASYGIKADDSNVEPWANWFSYYMQGFDPGKKAKDFFEYIYKKGMFQI